MVAVRESYPQLTPEEYLAWEVQQEVKHEYLNGEVYAMTGGTINHGRIGGNFYSLIDNHLGDGGCMVLNSDVRVNIQESNDYVYPDVSVSCDERDEDATQFIQYPCMIVEVLSPTTERYDRGDKFEMYRRSNSLREYVLVSADKIAIDLHRKDDRGQWKSIYYRGGDSIELVSINLTFPIQKVYRGIKF